MNLTEFKKEYATQNNRATAYPIYITVQEFICIGCINDNYSVLCPYGDGEKRYEHDCENCKKYPCWDEDIESEPAHCSEDIAMGYIWHPVEFFLTIKGAKEYIRLNKHNHFGKLRTYVHYFNRRNVEMNNLLKELKFKTED